MSFTEYVLEANKRKQLKNNCFEKYANAYHGWKQKNTKILLD